MNPIEIIWQNFPLCQEYREDAFCGILHSERRLDMNAYWRLEAALVQLTQNESDYPRHLSWPVFRIFSRLERLISADLDPNDGFKIQDFDGEKSRDFTERFELVFEGFFRGDMPDLTLAFEERNPLLE
jgi:hypothetical protein